MLPHRRVPDFIPSAEWRVIEPGQAVPPGIHVRMNLQTGANEGKLMGNTSDESAENQLSITSLNDSVPIRKSESHKMKVIIGPVKLMDSPKLSKTMTRTHSALIQNGVSMMMSLFERYEKYTVESKRCAILDELAGYLQLFDNAVSFVSSGALAKLAQDLLTAPWPVKEKIFQCLNSAMQGNSPVKSKMLDFGFLDLIAQLWSDELHSSTGPDPALISHCIFSLSIFLRHNPPAQTAFLGPAGGGSRILNETTTSSAWICQRETCRKLKMQIFVLLGDLVHEQNEAELFEPGEMDAYPRALLKEMCGQSWSYELVNFLTDNESNLDHDALEKVLKAGLQIVPLCSTKEIFRDQTKRASFSVAMQKLQQKYLTLTEADESTDELGYFKQVHALIRKFSEVSLK